MKRVLFSEWRDVCAEMPPLLREFASRFVAIKCGDELILGFGVGFVGESISINSMEKLVSHLRDNGFSGRITFERSYPGESE